MEGGGGSMYRPGIRFNTNETKSCRQGSIGTDTENYMYVVKTSTGPGPCMDDVRTNPFLSNNPALELHVRTYVRHQGLIDQALDDTHSYTGIIVTSTLAYRNFIYLGVLCHQHTCLYIPHGGNVALSPGSPIVFNDLWHLC